MAAWTSTTRCAVAAVSKVENLTHAASPHYVHYHFAHRHATLTTAAGGYKPDARDGCGDRKVRLDASGH
jgi:hypothetical protein